MLIISFILVFLAGYVCGVFMQNKVSELEKHNFLLPDRDREEE